ncbi:hypothetical protein IWZ03DRAFT_420759 [Phyllosticta citriasiana]|uniref:Uncharacterized protein n=1 Tax=Phyllosticta citriasiana TaxID=595635 RepID=A0ABR1KTK5_9PEZI
MVVTGAVDGKALMNRSLRMRFDCHLGPEIVVVGMSRSAWRHDLHNQSPPVPRLFWLPVVFHLFPASHHRPNPLHNLFSTESSSSTCHPLNAKITYHQTFTSLQAKWIAQPFAAKMKEYLRSVPGEEEFRKRGQEILNGLMELMNEGFKPYSKSSSTSTSNNNAANEIHTDTNVAAPSATVDASSTQQPLTDGHAATAPAPASPKEQPASEHKEGVEAKTLEPNSATATSTKSEHH